MGAVLSYVDRQDTGGPPQRPGTCAEGRREDRTIVLSLLKLEPREPEPVRPSSCTERRLIRTCRVEPLYVCDNRITGAPSGAHRPLALSPNDRTRCPPADDELRT